MIRHDFRLGLDQLGEFVEVGAGDLPMILFALRAQQSLIGGLVQKRMLERIGRGRRGAGDVKYLRFHQLVETLEKLILYQGRDGREDVVRKFATDDGGDLHDRLAQLQPIEPGGEQTAQRGRDVEIPTGGLLIRRAVDLALRHGFVNGLDLLFEEERDSVAPVDDGIAQR